MGPSPPLATGVIDQRRGAQGSIPFGVCVNRAFALAIAAGGIDSFINLPDLGRPQ